MSARTALSWGVSAHRLCKNVTLYVNEWTSPAAGGPGPRPGPSHPPELHKPLLLVLPWFGSRPQAVAKYCEIYFRSGFDVLVVESEIKDFLWPRWGLDRGKGVLELLQSERFVSRPLLVHAFSIGGYTFAQLLIHMSRDKRRYLEVTNRIKGQIYDSLVLGSVEQMAIGLGKTLFPVLDTLVKRVSLLYFSVFKRQTVDYFNVGIDVFWNNPVKAPSLFFFCENDVMSNPRTVEELIAYWQKGGMDITAKKWEDSTHAGHLRRYPQEYLSTLDTFLQSLHIIPLKSKM